MVRTVPYEEAPKKSDIISRVASSPLNILADTLHEGYFSDVWLLRFFTSRALMAFIDSTYKW